MATIQDYRRSHVQYASVLLDISGTTSDVDVKSVSSLFDNVHVARELVLRTTQAIDIKFNDTANDIITLYKNEGIDMTEIPVENVYISTGNKGAMVRIWITGWN